MVGLIYCRSGGGKTVNSTRVKGEKNLLLCSDNSSVVLKNFPRDNLTVRTITHCEREATDDRAHFMAMAEAAAEEGYSNIIIDNLSDLFDMWILERDEKNVSKDRRQDYLFVYNQLKRLVRKASMFKCNVIFTAWEEHRERTLPDGSKYIHTCPKIPDKILDNICGLCNVVAYVTHAPDKSGAEVYAYILKPTREYLVKDQLYNRVVCKPENIFEEDNK